MTIKQSVNHQAANLVQAVISYLDINDDEFAENLQKDIVIALQSQRNDMREMAAKVCDDACSIKHHGCKAWLERDMTCPECPKGLAISIRDLK